MGIVYKITNNIDNKCYVGITKHTLNSANAHKKKIMCINPNTNEIIKIYNGLIDTKVDGFNPSCVCLCCKGKIKTHKKFIWKYVSCGDNDEST